MLSKEDVSTIERVLDKRFAQADKSLDSRFNQFEKRLDVKIDQKLKPIKDDISQIRSDIKRIVSFFDKEYLELRKRIERIEEHLQLPPTN